MDTFNVIFKPVEKLSKDGIINKAEKYSGENGAIAFARGFRTAVKWILPYVQDYHKSKIKKLIE